MNIGSVLAVAVMIVPKTTPSAPMKMMNFRPPIGQPDEERTGHLPDLFLQSASRSSLREADTDLKDSKDDTGASGTFRREIIVRSVIWQSID
jgi:hypothetical protein